MGHSGDTITSECARTVDCHAHHLLGMSAFVAVSCFLDSNMISNGSELLLLIPSIAPLIGSVVLPVLGAVPDSALIVFSGET